MDDALNNSFNDEGSDSIEEANAKINHNKTKKINKKSSQNKFKEEYFDFYDDVKNHTKGREDW